MTNRRQPVSLFWPLLLIGLGLLLLLQNFGRLPPEVWANVQAAQAQTTAAPELPPDVLALVAEREAARTRSRSPGSEGSRAVPAQARESTGAEPPTGSRSAV